MYNGFTNFNLVSSVSEVLKYNSSMDLWFINKQYFLKEFGTTSLFFLLIFCFQITDVYAHESEKENMIIIHIDEEGFVPDTISIEVGTEVVFENVGIEDHWPASNYHPSHTVYDGTSIDEHCFSENNSSFDACRSIKSGETWSFVFTKSGTHKYHDHLWPHLTGQIVVGGSENTELKNKNIFSRFLDYVRNMLSVALSLSNGGKENNKENVVLESGNTSADFYENLKNSFEKMVLESDPSKAIQELHEQSKNNKQILALCHDILHIIGHTAYGKYGSFKEAVKYQSDFCNSGYIHGLFESYFGSTDKPLTGLSEQCSNFATDKRQFDLWQCYHGIGHGFMYLTGGDLDKSLQLCKDGLQRPEDVSSCRNGAYMEVFNKEVLAKERDFVDSKNPLLTCKSREVNKEDCYLYIPAYLSQTLNMDFVDIFNECNKVESKYRGVCIGGVGSEAMKRNMSEPNKVFALCKLAGSNSNQVLCVSGATSMYMNQTGSYVTGKKMCESIQKPYQNTCHKIVEGRKSFFK